jgi:ketosteroid isomerase-like protein
MEAFNVRDIDAYLALCDPNVEVHTTMGVGGSVYHGHDGVRSWWRDLEDAWEQLRTEPKAYFDLGEHTLTFHITHGRGRESGAEVAMPAALVHGWRNGLSVYTRVYADRGDALKDLGVSQDVLEPIVP